LFGLRIQGLGFKEFPACGTGYGARCTVHEISAEICRSSAKTCPPTGGSARNNKSAIWKKGNKGMRLIRLIRLNNLNYWNYGTNGTRELWN